MIHQATLLFVKALLIGVFLSAGIQWVSEPPLEAATKLQHIQQVEAAETAQPSTTHSLKLPR